MRRWLISVQVQSQRNSLARLVASLRCIICEQMDGLDIFAIGDIDSGSAGKQEFVDPAVRLRMRWGC